MENGEMVVETSITGTSPAALTLWCGLESIKEALEELKLNPPSSHWIIRFQVLEDMRGLLQPTDERKQAAVAELSGKHQKDKGQLLAIVVCRGLSGTSVLNLCQM
ncbi:protein GRIP-like [Carica papaya]|uniref:protein GRIP-like n=1 Tax=Carica papaya TaxID=3649 RepID=UPI000B8CF18A|nr:protein GRIP-like [Carica papaya]